MTLFVLTFVFLMVTIFAMSLGVLLAGKRITGSCGGLNAIADSDKCLVCDLPIDSNSPLRERLLCPRKKGRDLKAKLDGVTPLTTLFNTDRS